MMRRPTIPLTPAEHAVLGRWTRCMLATWAVVVVATLSLSMLGSGRAPAPMAECSEMVCLQQVVQTGTARR